MPEHEEQQQAAPGQSVQDTRAQAGQPGQDKPAGKPPVNENDPEFLRKAEARLRQFPAWLVAVAAIGVGLLIGAIAAIVRGCAGGSP